MVPSLNLYYSYDKHYFKNLKSLLFRTVKKNKAAGRNASGAAAAGPASRPAGRPSPGGALLRRQSKGPPLFQEEERSFP